MRICIPGKSIIIVMIVDAVKSVGWLIVSPSFCIYNSNVLVRAIPIKSNPKKVKYSIIFIDAGIATSLQPDDRKNLHDLFKAIVLNDGYTAGRLMVERARYERCTSKPGAKHVFATGVANIVSEFHDRRKQGKHIMRHVASIVY